MVTGKTPLLENILSELECFAPQRWAESWDNPGLQVGSRRQPVSRIFLSLDPTLTAVQRAVRSGADLLLTHHPLVFKPMSSLDVNRYPGSVIVEALKGGLSVVAAHTNLDVAPGGINDILADLVGLENRKWIKPLRDEEKAGLGRVGDLPQPLHMLAVKKRVLEVLGNRAIRIGGAENDRVRRMAVVGGSGGSLTALAAEKGAEVLLTGDVSHHQALEAQSLGLTLMDGGHFQTEKVAFNAFADPLRRLLSKKGWEVTVTVDEEETDPLYSTDT